MVAYEVNLEIEKDITDEFARWLKGHIKEMLQFEGFEKAYWWVDQDKGKNQPSKTFWTVQYQIISRANLDDYLQNHASKMRGHGLKKFEGKFSANRRILEEVTT